MVGTVGEVEVRGEEGETITIEGGPRFTSQLQGAGIPNRGHLQRVVVEECFNNANIEGGVVSYSEALTNKLPNGWPHIAEGGCSRDIGLTETMRRTVLGGKIGGGRGKEGVVTPNNQLTLHLG